jgi:4-amino-4-deoxy-L-arabinose transferase-like glycosyltransferase
MAERRVLARELLLLACFCGYFFFFGLGYFGLVGADEPRYAQVAREMLARHDWITPVLGGQPWLEKPVLYYWQAMLAYKIFGVSDWAARLPSAADATLMVLAVYFFFWRFRRGVELDAALLTASAAGVIGYARAASMDMPLAATFTIALLAWYGWYESGAKKYLAGFYIFVALGILAKGPVALFLAALVIAVFVALQREWGIIRRTLWLPGILLFCAVGMPWYVAVQVRNTEFLRVFILQHNLERFGTNLYHHTQPFWYYIPVALLGLMPVAVFVIAAVADGIKKWRTSRVASGGSSEALNLFFAVWLIVPIIFFSISQSKLPGYILPALPAGILLLADYIRRHVIEGEKPAMGLTVVHSAVAALPVVPAFVIPYIVWQHRFPMGREIAFPLVLAVLLAMGTAAALNSRLGLRALRLAAVLTVVVAVGAVLKIGAPSLDASLSERPLAVDIKQKMNVQLPVAVLNVRREAEYGLQFYFNQSIDRYELGQIPGGEHLLVAPEAEQSSMQNWIKGRRVILLGQFAPQKLDYYWVSAR